MENISNSVVSANGEPKLRVAILFQRFGPYHHARLNAAGQVFAVWGVEACAMEDLYAWNKIEGAAAFTRVTLSDRNTGDRRWKQELHRQMWRVLDEIKPQVVVIPGWSSTDAFSAFAWCVKSQVPAVVMSESTAWDEARVNWKEWVKNRLVKLCAAGLAGGTPHADYLTQLGLSKECIFLGYDVVDNRYFSEKSEILKGENGKRKVDKAEQKVESRKQKTKHGGSGIEAEDSDQFQLSASPISAFSSSEAEREARVESGKQYGLPEKYFLASARFVEKKNLFWLLKAYAEYRKKAEMLKGENGKLETKVWDLILLGDGPLKPELKRLIAELGLGACVHLPGFKQYEELPAYFGQAQIFVHASTTEQWGLVVNEAMASGLPVLVSNRCGCAMDLVAEGVNGFTFDPGNIEELAQLLRRVSDPEFPLANFGAASTRIIAGWGPERFANGLRGAVTTALKNPRPPAGWLDRLLLQLLLRW